jgi:hypothetical protein
MYMLIPEICSEHASHLYVLEGGAHLGSSLVTIVITRFVMNT